MSNFNIDLIAQNEVLNLKIDDSQITLNRDFNTIIDKLSSNIKNDSNKKIELIEILNKGFIIFIQIKCNK